MNESKKCSPQSWNKWLMAGAIAGASYRPGPNGFGTVRFDRSMSVREIRAFYKKCGLRTATVEDLKNFTETPAIPEPSIPVIVDCREPIRRSWWLDNARDHNFLPVLFMPE